MPTQGLFFLNKKRRWWQKEKSPAEKLEELMPIINKLMPSIREMLGNGSAGMGGINVDSIQAISEGQVVGRLYDFWQNYNNSVPQAIEGWQTISNNGMGVTFTASGIGNISPVEKPDDGKMRATPKSVVEELNAAPTPLSMEGIDEKIETLKKKSKMVSHQIYTKAQVDGMIKRLEYRKRYHEQAAFYEQFPRSTDEKIDALLAKYKLEINKPDLFIPTFPKEAIDVMDKYTEVTRELTGEEPVFYVIAEESAFRKKREKLDPIILAQSPFAFVWDVLGAWDKEMLLLSEL